MFKQSNSVRNSVELNTEAIHVDSKTDRHDQSLHCGRMISLTVSLMQQQLEFELCQASEICGCVTEDDADVVKLSSRYEFTYSSNRLGKGMPWASRLTRPGQAPMTMMFLVRSLKPMSWCPHMIATCQCPNSFL
eukprot:4689675-Amphidinium_carterae.1